MISLLLLAAAPADAAAKPAPTFDYGQAVTYDQGVKVADDFVKSDLLDPYSAHVEWPFEFVPFTEKLPLSKRITGYATCGTVNAKNAYGAYTGTKQFRVIVRDGKVIDYREVSELRFVPDICKELLTQFGMTEHKQASRSSGL